MPNSLTDNSWGLADLTRFSCSRPPSPSQHLPNISHSIVLELLSASELDTGTLHGFCHCYPSWWTSRKKVSQYKPNIHVTHVLELFVGSFIFVNVDKASSSVNILVVIIPLVSEFTPMLD